MSAHRSRAPLPALVAPLVAALVLVTLVAAPRAEAHAGLASSSPADGAVLEAAPAEVRLGFTEELQEPAYVVVTAPDGTRSSSQAAVVEGADAVQAVPAPAGGDAEGVWRIAFRVVSADGHPITGELSFTVDPTGPRDGGTLEGDDPPATAPPAPAARTRDEGFWARHADHVALGAALLLAAAVLVQLSRRSRP